MRWRPTNSTVVWDGSSTYVAASGTVRPWYSRVTDVTVAMRVPSSSEDCFAFNNRLTRENSREMATRWLSDDEQRTWRALLRGSLLLLDRLDGELQQTHGLSLSDYE